MSDTSDTGRELRDMLAQAFKAEGWEPRFQEDRSFQQGVTLEALAHKIRDCDFVIHFVPAYPGSSPTDETSRRVCLEFYLKRPRSFWMFPNLSSSDVCTAVTYTQWEALLAVADGKPLFILQEPGGQEKHIDTLRKAKQYVSPCRWPWWLEAERTPERVNEFVSSFLSVVEGDEWLKARADLIHRSDSESPIKLRYWGEDLAPRERFAALLLDDSPRKLVTAPACYGKSSAVTWTAARSPRRDEVVAVYDCSDSKPNTGSFGTFVRSLAAQFERFAEFKLPTGGILSKTFTTDLRRRLMDPALETEEGDGAYKAAKETLDELFKALDPANAVGAYLLIDAVDELPVKSGDANLAKLIFEYEWPERLRVRVTAQPRQEPSYWKSARWVRHDIDTHQDDRPGLANEQREVCRQIVAKIAKPAASETEEWKRLVEEIVEGTRNDLLYAKALADELQRAAATTAGVGELRSILRSELGASSHARSDGRNSSKLEFLPWRDYIGGKFKKWFPEDERTESKQVAKNLVALMVAQKRSQPVSRLARAAGDSTESSKLTCAVLDKLATYLERASGDNGPLTATSTVGFGHLNMVRWLVRAEGMEAQSEFQNSRQKERGDQLWAQLVASVKKFDDATATFVVEDGFDHLQSAIAAERKSVQNAPPLLSSLFETHRRVADWLDRRASPSSAASVRHRLPRRYADAFRALAECYAAASRATADELSEYGAVIAKMVEVGADEVPALYAPLRVLADNGFRSSDSGEASLDLFMSIVSSDQLVSRYELGRALADAYYEYPRNQDVLLKIVDELCTRAGLPLDGGPYTGPTDDEQLDALDAAGYCFRFLWARRSPGKYSRALKRRYDALAEAFGNHDFASIRMPFGEALVERCCDPAGDQGRIDDGVSPWNSVPLKSDSHFYAPVWHYHCLDLAEAVGTWLHRTGTSLDALSEWTSGMSKERKETMTKLTAIVVDRLAEAERGLQFAASDDPMREAALAYWRTERLLATLRPVDVTDDSWNDFTTAERRLRPFALHPVWEVTEAAASKLSELRERSEAGKATADRIIEAWGELEGSPTAESQAGSYWQLVYAAVDAAYNSRGRDDGAIGDSLFARLVRQHKDHPQFSRVRFICAEDTFLWFNAIKDAYDSVADATSKEYFAAHMRQWWEAFSDPIAYWLRCGDDSALTYEVFQWAEAVANWCSEEEERDETALAETLREMRSAADAARSPFVNVSSSDGECAEDGAKWYELGCVDWLRLNHRRKVESIGRGDPIWPVLAE